MRVVKENAFSESSIELLCVYKAQILDLNFLRRLGSEYVFFLVSSRSFMLLSFDVMVKVGRDLKVGWRILAMALIGGVCIGLVSGLVENKPGSAGIPENKYYGYPLIWRLSDPFTGEKYSYFELLVDCIFWVAVALVLALLATLLKRNRKV